MNRLIVLILLSCSLMRQSLAWAQTNETSIPNPLVGEWVVVERRVRNETNKKNDALYRGAIIVVSKDGDAEIKLNDGKKKTAKYKAQWQKDNGKLFGLLIEEPDDTLAMGGGGSRKVLLRKTSESEIEMLEQPRADKDYPNGFDVANLEKGLWLRWKKKN